MAESVLRMKQTTGASPATGNTSLWLETEKTTVARFARGNIPAQWRRILTEEEQDEDRARTKKIARKWRERAEKSASN